MAVPTAQFLELVRGLTGPEARRRERGADEVTDLVGSCAQDQVGVLAGVLAAAAVREQDLAALESELHALIELGASGLLDAAFLAPLRQIDRAALPGTLAEYLDDLLEET